MSKTAHIKQYVISPYTKVLRDEKIVFPRRVRTNDTAQSFVLESYLNDLYHFFLHKLTDVMHTGNMENEAKLRSLFDELLKTKKLLQEMDEK